MKIVRLLFTGIALLFSLSPVVASEPIFILPASPLELVTSETKFRPFAETVRRDVERLLRQPKIIDDPVKLKTLLSTRVHLAHYFADNEQAIATAAWIRSLQTDPVERSFAGLTTLASVAARLAHPGAEPSDPDYRRTFAREFAHQLEALPSTAAITAMLHRQQLKIAELTVEILYAETGDHIAPALSRRGHCGLAEADQLVRARHRLVGVLPVKAEILKALSEAIAARPAF